MQSYKIHDHSPGRSLLRRRRPGTTLVEAILAMVIVFIVIIAVLTTVAASTHMIGTSRDDLGISTLAANWFEVLEAQTPDILSNDFSVAVGNAAKTIDHNATGSGMSYTINGYTLTAARGTPNDGIVTVSVSILNDQGAKRRAGRFEKTFNTFSNATVTNEYAQVGYGGDE